MIYLLTKYLYDWRAKVSTNITCNRIYYFYHVKLNLIGVSVMKCDLTKVLHLVKVSMKSVAHFGSWILNIYIYWIFSVWNLHININAELLVKLKTFEVQGTRNTASDQSRWKPNWSQYREWSWFFFQTKSRFLAQMVYGSKNRGNTSKIRDFFSMVVCSQFFLNMCVTRKG